MAEQKRLWAATATAAVLAAALALAAGCARSAPAPKPAPKPGSTTSSTNPGDEISRLVKGRVKDARGVETIVVGNVAVVGIDRGKTARPTAPTTPTPGAPTPGAPGVTTPPTTAPPSGAATPPTTVAPSPDRINVLSTAVRNEITRRFPQIARVHSTDDPNLISRLFSIARDIRNRRSVDGRANEMAYLVNVTSPATTVPPSRTGMPNRRVSPDQRVTPGGTAPAPAPTR